MSRETILSGEPQGEDGDRDLRPQSIHQMVGQRSVYERLKIAVDAAVKREDPLGHILFDGPPGLGKTTFALCLPREMGVNVQLTSGPTLQAPKDLVPYLTNAEARSSPQHPVWTAQYFPRPTQTPAAPAAGRLPNCARW